MKFSFVIPVFNTEQYLPRCLDSLVAQSDGDFEAIIIDDCSPSAEEIVARYDERFKCIRQDRNRSTFQAKATGAKAVTGDYIVPLDSDDYVLPGLVSALKEEVRATVQPSTFSTRSRRLPDGQGVSRQDISRQVQSSALPLFGRGGAGQAFRGPHLHAGLRAIRREVFLKAYEGLGVGPDFYLNFTDDLCWLLPILFNTKTVSFIPYKGYRYWRHDDSMTKDVMAEERIRSLAEQSRRSVETVIAYARRLGRDEQTIAEIRAQLYPTIRWLMRDMGQSREVLEAAYGAELVNETLKWDAAAGGSLVKMVRHLVKYGVGATVREVVARIRGIEI